jgi:hypothetical protein
MVKIVNELFLAWMVVGALISPIVFGLILFDEGTYQVRHVKALTAEYEFKQALADLPSCAPKTVHFESYDPDNWSEQVRQISRGGAR